MSCCDLAEIAPPAVEPPDGVEIVTWAQRPELARGIYEVALEALPDIPGSEDDDVEPFEDWLAHDMQGSGDRPDATFVAVAGEEVVGYAKFSLTAAQPTTAHHDLSGVKTSLARPRHRACAEGGADQLGARQRLHASCTPATSSGTSRSGG